MRSSRPLASLAAALGLLASGCHGQPCLGVISHVPLLPPGPVPQPLLAAPSSTRWTVAVPAHGSSTVTLPAGMQCEGPTLHVERNSEPPVSRWLRDDDMPTAQCDDASHQLLVTLSGSPPVRHGDRVATVRVSSAAGAPSLEVTLEVPASGFADLHAHPASHLAFGGRTIWGMPCGTGKEALHPCGVDHDTLQVLTSDSGDHHHGHDGYPDFASWPTADGWTHQQFHVAWLDRARRGGQRLLVAHAVDNERLCDVRSTAVDPYLCHGDPMFVVQRQLAFLFDMQRYVDALSGGPGLGWFRIVRTPDEAEGVIRAGNLAVVLGIEVDRLLDCTCTDLACQRRSLADQVQRLCGWGVRHIFPVHFRTNQFGGPALSNPMTGPYEDTEECGAEGYQYPGAELLTRCNSHTAACSRVGLTGRGHEFVQSMMDSGMLIDVDHMGRRARNDTLALARSKHYPLVSGHTEFLDLSLHDARSERGLSVADLQALDELGSMLSPLARQTVAARELRPAPWSGVPATCADSAEGLAQALAFAQGFFRGPIAFGTDMMGGIDPPGPRFSRQGQQVQACPFPYELGGAAPGHPAPMLAGCFQLFPGASGLNVQWHDGLEGSHREWDYNFDGVAHAGMLPDFVADVQQHLHERAAPLLRSALEYVNLWRRAERTAAANVLAQGGTLALCSASASPHLPAAPVRIPLSAHRTLACPVVAPGEHAPWTVDTCAPASPPAPTASDAGHP